MMSIILLSILRLVLNCFLFRYISQDWDHHHHPLLQVDTGPAGCDHHNQPLLQVDTGPAGLIGLKTSGPKLEKYNSWLVKSKEFFQHDPNINTDLGLDLKDKQTDDERTEFESVASGKENATIVTTV